MKSKGREKVSARHLRKKGLSLKEIAQKLRVAKSSVSVWVKDVKLTKSQERFLSHKAHLREVIKKRVETRIKNERERRRKIIDGHKQDLKNIRISPSGLVVIGSVLYWAEGGKSDRNRMFKFSNGDPQMIKVIMSFLRKSCRIPEERLRGHIHLHPHLNTEEAEKYWSSVSKIPTSQFYKTSQSHNKRSSNTRDNLPYGTFNVEICSTDLYLKMLAWIEVVREKILKSYS